MKKCTEKNVCDGDLFISRDLSWIDFNARVLDEAACVANPLLERLKFIAIFSGNLDEYFMVRIASLRQLVRIGQDLPDPAGLRPSEELLRARKKLEPLLKRQYSLLLETLLPELAKHGVHLLKMAELSPSEREQAGELFRSRILPVLTPLAVDAAHPFPFLNSGAIEIAVSMHPAGKRKAVRAFVEVPELLPRFIPLPGAGRSYVLLEELISAHLDQLFAGCEIVESFPFRITRDMDFSVDDDGADDLLATIEKKLIQRRRREPIRLELPARCHGELTDWLVRELAIEPLSCYSLPGPLHLKQFFELIGKVNLPELLEPAWPPVVPAEFCQAGGIFLAVANRGTILLAPPYHSFSPVIRMLEEAAADPEVLAIKQTLYRVSGNSPVVHALQLAAENGKQVTVVLELKARFDEGNNIAWARALEESGAHVVYGVSQLKVHAKALLVVRREEDGAIRRYVHLATGNYNDKTAALYTDVGIFSCDPELCFDVSNFFNVLTGCSAPPGAWRRVAVSPFDLREKVSALIEREIRRTTSARPGRIIAKLNSLSDEKMIRLLHRAADAGVEIDLIVRGICCLRPKPGQENLRIISIVDRYLEHTRLFCFGRDGEEEYFLSSADWMSRNLDRRVELFFPVEEPGLRRVLKRLLEFQLADRDKGRRLLGSGVYTRCLPEQFSSLRSQANSYRYFCELSEAEKKRVSGDALKVFTRPEEKRE